MGKLSEKVAYINGLADGMDLQPDSKESKLLLSILDALLDIAEAVDEQETVVTDLIDGIDSINEDLSDLEKIVYGEDDDESTGLDDDEEFEEDDFIELECPDCGEVVYFSSEMFDNDEDPICPNCGGIIELDHD